MKKIINISLITLLCFGLALSLVGCGKASREFSMDGHNLSSLDSDLIIKKIVDAEKLKTAEIYVNADNFELRLTSDFDWADDGAIRFFYKEKQNTYSAQIRIFNEDNQYFITKPTKWVEQDKSFYLKSYLDALKYMPQEEIRNLSLNADRYLITQVEEGNPDDYEQTIPYCPSGIKESNGWMIHLSVLPMYKADDGSYTGSGYDEAIHLFFWNN